MSSTLLFGCFFPSRGNSVSLFYKILVTFKTTLIKCQSVPKCKTLLSFSYIIGIIIISLLNGYDFGFPRRHEYTYSGKTNQLKQNL